MKTFIYYTGDMSNVDLVAEYLFASIVENTFNCYTILACKDTIHTVNENDILLVVRVGKDRIDDFISHDMNYTYDTGFFVSSVFKASIAIQILAHFDEDVIFEDDSSYSKQVEEIKRKLL